jgi:hypothetical protein
MADRDAEGSSSGDDDVHTIEGAQAAVEAAVRHLARAACGIDAHRAAQRLDRAKGNLGLMRLKGSAAFAQQQSPCSSSAAKPAAPSGFGLLIRTASVTERLVPCTFHLESDTVSPRSAELTVTLPIPSQDYAEELQEEVHDALGLAQWDDIVAVRRYDTPSFPPLPLLLLHGLTSPLEARLAVSVIVRPAAMRGSAPSYLPAPALPPIELDDLLSTRNDSAAGGELSPDAREQRRMTVALELLRRLQCDGVARVRGNAQFTAATRGCLRAMRTFFEETSEDARLRMHTHVACAATAEVATSKRYAGFGDDVGREWIQLRLRPGGATEHADERVSGHGCGIETTLSNQMRPSPLLPDSSLVPVEFGVALTALRIAATACLQALAKAFGLEENAWTALTDVEPTYENDESCDGVQLDPGMIQGGASVLRLLRYITSVKGGKGCTLHADLGLVTISPAPMRLDGEQADASAGLQVYDVEHQQWREAEVGLAEDEFSVFAGEQLAFLTNGRIRAALHRVQAPNTRGRFAMPFFVRAHPNSMLHPAPSAFPTDGTERDAHAHAEVPLPRMCEEFVVNELFRRRPWRRPLAAGIIPDY